MKKYFPILFLFFLLIFQQVQAQKKRDSLQSQTVTITRSYTPTVGDADKIQVNPPVTVSEDFRKIPLQYRPLELEAVSTFLTEKGKSKKPSVSFERYAASPGFAELAVGNQKALRLRGWYLYRLENDWKIGGGLSYETLGQTATDTLLLTAFSNLESLLTAQKNTGLADWRIQAGYNRYGSAYRDTLQPFSRLAEPLAVHNIYAGLKSDFHRTVFKKIRFRYDYSSLDNFSGNDIALRNTNIFPVGGFDIATVLSARYTGGQNGTVSYNNFQAGLFPSLRLDRERFHFKLGLKLFYQNRTDINDRFLFYPDIAVNYDMVYELLSIYLNYEGDLRTVSYKNLWQENRYVLPSTALVPTSTPYHFYGGFRGQIGSRLAYDLQLGLTKENNKPLLHERFSPRGLGLNIIYDNVEYYYFRTNLSYVVPRFFETKINFDYYQYSPETQAKAWNLPDYKLAWLMRFRIGKFTWGNELYYYAPRLDKLNLLVPVKAGDFLSANLRLGYQAGKNLHIYVEGNNLLNRNYQMYYAYPVHGLHILAGASYTF